MPEEHESPERNRELAPMSLRTWTDDALIKACADSKNKSEVIRRLGLFYNSGNFQTIDKYIKKLGIDISHFEIGVSHSNSVTKIPLSSILIMDSDYSNTSSLKARLISEGVFQRVCESCKLDSWLNQPIPLELDHINGSRTDNRIENLRLLCPTCHALTETYCRGTRRAKKNFCLDCKAEIQLSSKRCHPCNGFLKQNSNTKIVWPSDDDLTSLVSELGFVGAGKKLGVSDNAIRKRLKNNRARRSG